MSPAAEAFAVLLEQERAAAVRADTDALVEISRLKEQALARAREDGIDREEAAALHALAERNILLLSLLVSCLRGVVEPVDVTRGYGPDGHRVSRVATGPQRGCL